MRRIATPIQGIIIMLVLMVSPALAEKPQADLTPKERYSILKAEVVRNLRAKNYPEVLKLVGEIRKLDVSIPDAMLFVEGKALLRTGKLAEAMNRFDDYIDKAGKKGEFYKKAVRLRGQAKKKRKRKDQEEKMKLMSDEERKQFLEEVAKKKQGKKKCDKRYNTCLKLSLDALRKDTNRQLSTETEVQSGGDRVIVCRLFREACYAPFED